MIINYKEVPNGHGIKAEVSILPTEDHYLLFGSFKHFGYNHILLNNNHTIINKETFELIPCKSYDMAQEWCYKFTCKHLML